MFELPVDSDGSVNRGLKQKVDWERVRKGRYLSRHTVS